MATRPATQEGASAPSNVVRLPTAAPRKVRQQFGRGNAFAVAKADCIAFPRRFIWPSVREKADEARLFMETPRTPELALALALFEALDDGDKRRARLFLSVLALTWGEAGEKALAAIRSRTFGEQNDIHAATRLIEEGEL